MSNDRWDDALTLAVKAWLISPRMSRGTMTIKLNEWYGRIVAAPIAFEEEEE